MGSACPHSTWDVWLEATFLNIRLPGPVMSGNSAVLPPLVKDFAPVSLGCQSGLRGPRGGWSCCNLRLPSRGSHMAT